MGRRDLDGLAGLETWAELHSMVAVEPIRTAHRPANVTSDDRFSLSRLTRSVADVAALIRPPWPIENKRHGSLDVTFNEDRGRRRQDPVSAHLAALRRLALN